MRRLALLLGALLLAGCGDRREVREADLVLGDRMQEPAPREPRPAGLRIAVVTHGQASSPFWTVVRNGIDAARRQVDVNVDYRAPDVYSVQRMAELVDEAIASEPDALVLSLPDQRIAVAARRAVVEGIPTVTINSGGEMSRATGAITHIGQPEDRAGLEAGRRLARAGVRRGLCVNHEVGNGALDVRCAGFARAVRAAGGTTRVVGVDVKSGGAARRLAEALRGNVDGVLALSADGAQAVLDAQRIAGRPDLELATFDLSPEVLDAVKDGRLIFTVDQQPFLQGYLPVVLLSQRVRYGLFPVPEDVLDTGPNFVTKDNADQALRLSRRAIR